MADSSRGFRIISPTAILGYGFPEASLHRGMERRPHALAVDAGSVDPGPYYLGAGIPFVSREAVHRDLRLLLRAARSADIPMLIGTAGGAGARAHVDWTLDILGVVAREEGCTLDAGVIYSDVPERTVRRHLERGELEPLDHAPALDAERLGETSAIVAQIGCPPIQRALRRGFQLVVCGRAYDPAVFAAPAIEAGHSPALALHMGKILECAAIAAEPGSGRDAVLGTLYADYFDLETLSDERRFTDYSVAAHALYEKSNPYRLPGPEGTLDLTDARYEELADGRVRVSGSQLAGDSPHRVKIEGARKTGYRALFIAGSRDPGFLHQLDAIAGHISGEVRARYPDVRTELHVYGRDGVMGPREPAAGPAGNEVGLVVETLAPDQDTASAACALFRSTMLHYGYPGRMSTAGNLAFPFSPSDIPCGPCYEFSIYHLMASDAEQSAFQAIGQEIGT